MRDSNYKSISNNKAAVTITTSLYDRRALDVTSDKPLVNSLNHLTYLVSSSAKVRETLSVDGGIERLIEILHECHNSTFNLNDNIFNNEKKLLTAWKWTLTFQCLVLIGTRGTETIRQKVVKAGILPIIATVLDNYLSMHERTFIHANSRQQPQQQQSFQQHHQQTGNSNTQQDFPNNFDNLQNNLPPHLPNSQFEFNNLTIPVNAATAAVEATSISTSSSYPTFFNNNHSSNLTSDDYDNLSIDQLFKLIRVNHKTNTISNDIRRRYLIASIIKKLREEKEIDILDDRFLNDCDYEMDNNLQFLSDLYLQDHDHNKFLMNSKIAPRNFTETGVVIPRDDDIVWSLQLLAYISKYPYLKDILQNTHLVIDMSIRDKQLKLYLEKQLKLKLKKNLAVNLRPTITPKSRKTKTTYLERFNPSASNSPQMLNEINTIDNFILEEYKLELCNKPEEPGLTENAEIEDDSEECYDEEEEEELDDNEPNENDDIENNDNELDNLTNIANSNSNYLSQLYDSIIDSESIVNDLEREICLFQINEKINKFIEIESKKLVGSIINKRRETKLFLTEKWNYDTYSNFDIDEVNEDQDDSLIEYKKVNLFPMVEKFTFLSGTDMYYWSGVIMRNSCRRNEYRGGVRQCGNLECGKWEKYPREFSKCRRCKRTKYCSRECQMRAWHCHRNWCIPSNSSTTTGTSNNQQPNPNELSQAADDDQESQRDHLSESS